MLDVGDSPCDAEVLDIVRPKADVVLCLGVVSLLLPAKLGILEAFQVAPERDVTKPVANGPCKWYQADDVAYWHSIRLCAWTPFV